MSSRHSNVSSSEESVTSSRDLSITLSSNSNLTSFGDVSVTSSATSINQSSVIIGHSRVSSTDDSSSSSSSSMNLSKYVDKNWIPPLIDPIPLPNRRKYYVIEKTRTRRPEHPALSQRKRHFKLPEGWLERREQYHSRDNGYVTFMTKRIKELEALTSVDTSASESGLEDQAASTSSSEEGGDLRL